MAIGINAAAWGLEAVSILAEEAAADCDGYDARDATKTDSMGMPRTSKWRGPALTSPLWRAWTPGAPVDQIVSVALWPSAVIPALTSPAWRAWNPEEPRRTKPASTIEAGAVTRNVMDSPLDNICLNTEGMTWPRGCRQAETSSGNGRGLKVADVMIAIRGGGVTGMTMATKTFDFSDNPTHNPSHSEGRAHLAPTAGVTARKNQLMQGRFHMSAATSYSEGEGIIEIKSMYADWGYDVMAVLMDEVIRIGIAMMEEVTIYMTVMSRQW